LNNLFFLNLQFFSILDGFYRITFTADDSLWCNATWDGLLCWQAIPANTSFTQFCPDEKGLESERKLLVEETRKIMYLFASVANVRILDLVALGLSFFTLLISVAIFLYFRRLRVFRNLLHVHLMASILGLVFIRLVMYIDLQFLVINIIFNSAILQPLLCWLSSVLLEYFKCVAFFWMFLEGFYLHNQLVLTVFNAEPRLKPYVLVGYGVPCIHILIWLLAIYCRRGKFKQCLGSYWWEREFWILEGPRLFQLVINTLFIFNVLRVLWSKVKNEACKNELARMKKSAKAAMMLMALLGVPNIMQLIPLNPTNDNKEFFVGWTYCASATHMFQGFVIACIYCFTNREVRQLKQQTSYSRYRLKHGTSAEVRRSSRLPSTVSRNKKVPTSGSSHTLTCPNNRPIKKGSDDSTTGLLAESREKEQTKDVTEQYTVRNGDTVRIL
uniref:G_PROTEIN_RECEP_F2_4 domain-containing protein n=1 Tax=Enterobius vermicularis TaxID=51028 RepID=A0A0N4UY16_ENTVE